MSYRMIEAARRLMCDKFSILCTLAELNDKQAKEDAIMNFNEYQELSARTANKHANELVNYGLGIAGEAGEVADLIKKAEFHGHRIEKDEVKKELGDVMWYVSQIARVAGLTLDEIAVENINKLKRRYPEGFSSEASVNRVEEAE